MKAWEAGYAVRWAATDSFHNYLTGSGYNTTYTTYTVTQKVGEQATGMAYVLIPKYHGPDCALKRCPVSNNNRYNAWLECNGEGACDSETGRCECNERFYMPNCAKKRCPVSPKTGKVCDGKGWCDSKTGLCVCNRDPALGLEYPVDHHPWYAVTGSSWNNGASRRWNSTHSGLANQMPYRAGDMSSVGQQEVMKAWEAGYAVRWAATDSFNKYLSFQQHSLHGGSWRWWERTSYETSWPWWTSETATDTTKNESGTINRRGITFPRILGDKLQDGIKSTYAPPYELIPKHYGPNCAMKRCPVSNNNQYKIWFECNYHGTCDNLKGVCKCNDGWFGDDCSRKRCPISPLHNKECAGHGSCESATGNCKCWGVYFGSSCEMMRCPFSNANRGDEMLECNGQGRCDRATGECRCYDPAYSSVECVKRRCPVYPKFNGLTCNGHGACQSDTGNCACHYEWSGADCSIQAPDI